MLNKKLYVYRIRPNSITDYNLKASIPPYLEPLLVHFNGNERNTKEYHKARSWLLMLESLESDLDSNPQDIALLRKAFYPKFCEMILQLANFPEDPLNLLPKIRILQPYINEAKHKGVKVKLFKKLALYNPLLYRICSPLALLYRNIKDMERKWRKSRKAKG